MWRDVAMMFQDELGSDERLLWSGQPRKGLLLRGLDLFLIPFSLLWGGFAIFWEGAVIIAGAPFFFWLWGIPFVLVGLYLMFGRFFVDAKQRDKTYYALTNERIIIVSGLLNRSVTSLGLRALSGISLTQKGDGSRGTITFGPVHPMAKRFGGNGWPAVGWNPFLGFDMIENAKMVYDQILEAQKAAQ